MSSHLEQIQALIADIEGVLQQPSPRLPWMGETARDSRRVLERIRTYLQEQQKLALSEPPPQTRTRPTLQAEDIQSDSAALELKPYDPAKASEAGEILQAVVREMGALRSNLMQPLLSDIEALQRERDALKREIRSLDAQRQQQYSLAQQSAYQQQIIAEFLQTLMGRVQESLTEQVTQTLANLENQFFSYESLPNYSPPPLEAADSGASSSYVPIWDPSDAYGSVTKGPINPRDRIRSLQMLQERLDRTIGTLDSTIGIVFEALLRNVHGYEESLSSGLDRMHSLGQQGEMMFGQLVSHLAQKLGQEAAGLLQSSIHRSELEPTAPSAPAEPILEITEPPIGAQNPPDPEKARQKKDSPPNAARPATASKVAKNRDANNSTQRDRAKKLEALTAKRADAEARIDMLMNLEVETLSEAQAPDRAKSPLSEQPANPSPTEEIDGILELLGTEWPNSESAESSSGLASGWKATREVSSNESELDELYASLFGLEPTDLSLVEQTTGSNELIQNTEAAKYEVVSGKSREAKGLDRFEEALFEGFADPGIAGPPKPQPNPVAEPAAQSLEEFLFTEDSASAEIDSLTLTDLFAQTPALLPESASVTRSSTQSVSAESVTNLFGDAEVRDSLRDSNSPSGPGYEENASRQEAQQSSGTTPATKIPEPISVQPQNDEPDLTILTEEWAEDTYIPASPDEVLLPTSEQLSEQESSFSLDTSTLQQLKQDLSALEGFEDLKQPQRQTKQSLRESRASIVPVQSGLAPRASEPIPVSEPTSPSSEDWESLTLSDWAVDVGADLPQNSATLPEMTTKTQIEDRADKADDWLTEISASAEALPKARTISEPPLWDANDTQSMTLDEAFANLTEAIATPEKVEADFFESPTQFPNPTITTAPANDGNSSILDDLFASMNQKTLAAEASDTDADAFYLPSENSNSAAPAASSSLDDLLAGIWSETSTPDESVAKLDLVESPTESSEDLVFSNLDDLLASIWSEMPTPADPSANSDLFLKENDTGSATQSLSDTSPPSAKPARKDLRTGEKKKKPVRDKAERIVDVSIASVAPQSLRGGTVPEGRKQEKLSSVGSRGSSQSPVELISIPEGDSSHAAPSYPENIAALAESRSLDANENRARVWYLGIDFGTTGVSAVLSNRQSGEFYPIYWLEVQGKKSGNPVDRSFRIPAIAYRSSDRGDAASNKARSLPHSAGWFLYDFKPYLKVGVAPTLVVPDDEANSTPLLWDAMLQWSDRQEIPLSWVSGALQALLATLNPLKRDVGQGAGDSEVAIPDSQFSMPTLICGAAGLEMATLRGALSQLAGVIASRPAAWPDSYDFNVREAILGAGLVERPEQIVLVEEAIATLLSALPGGGGETLALPSSLSQKLNLFNADWRGLTLAISAGAATTELALVNLPENLGRLTHSHFAFRSYAYAGNAIDQDILCQLLLNEDWRRKNKEFFLHYPFSLMDFEELPRPGEPDLERRDRLQQLLREVPRELGLLGAVQYLKISLQSQERLSLEIASHRWVCTRKDLEKLVFVPFVVRLNRELNALLSQTGGLVQGINQAICTGPTASMAAIARWLRQKLPNATIIQDTYPIDSPPACSRVAYGLASVPFHASVFDGNRQQYSDYFLLLELLRAWPNQPVSVAEIMRLLERRGLNTNACKQRLLDLLEGHFPAGLAMSETDAFLLTSEFKQNPDYLGLHATPLFYKQDDGTYMLNSQQFQRVRHCANQLFARSYQKLEEPVTIDWGYKVRK